MTRPRKTWWDGVKEVMKRFDLSREDVQIWNKLKKKIKGRTANPGLPGRWSLN